MEYYNYIKSLHLIFVVTWFAGLFYEPRLFIYHIEASKKSSPEKASRDSTFSWETFDLPRIGPEKPELQGKLKETYIPRCSPLGVRGCLHIVLFETLVL